MALKPQFSLRWMFVAVAVVALIAAEAVAFPGWVAFLVGILVTSMLPPLLVAGIYYSRGFARAFCIGALAWLLGARWISGISLGTQPHATTSFATWFIESTNNNRENIEQDMRFWRVDSCIAWSLTIVGGLVAVIVRWFAATANGVAQPRSGDRI